MNTTAKLALGAVAVVAIALLGIRFLAPGSLSVGGDPEPTATNSPTATPSEIPLGERSMDAGRYWLGPDFPVEITFDLPAGWSSCSNGVLEQGACRGIGTTDAPGGVGVGFLIVDTVVADPCDATSLLDPPVGPSIDDLATAIANLPGFEATPVEDVSIDGFDAKRFTITAPEDPACDTLFTWATPTRTNGVGPGEANLIHAIDVDGVRVMLTSAYFGSQVSEQDLSLVEEVIASIRIEP